MVSVERLIGHGRFETGRGKRVLNIVCMIDIDKGEVLVDKCREKHSYDELILLTVKCHFNGMVQTLV